MSSRKESVREIEKRKSRLDHAASDLKEISDELTKRAQNAPPDLVVQVAAAEPMLAKAYTTFVQSSFDVDAATSAVSNIQQSPALSGIKVRSGSFRAKQESNVDEAARREFVLEWKEKNASRRRGWQSKLARAFSKRFNLSFDGARSYLKNHNYFVD